MQASGGARLARLGRSSHLESGLRVGLPIRRCEGARQRVPRYGKALCGIAAGRPGGSSRPTGPVAGAGWQRQGAPLTRVARLVHGHNVVLFMPRATRLFFCLFVRSVSRLFRPVVSASSVGARFMSGSTSNELAT